ncbi:MFS transporter [Cellulomonas sp. PhB143]|uniref:MFS transporter n=1 Tax=Cellulomonas sp. PhB143 TaxID=2485186 RepID=UPI000F47894C|nr:MFS transporter [Cellulomonas sp. PhB143]ROS75334.1 EmrB/QacA subfamily drug resistance transporter [Cellulomonas sp. PhB143]
MTTAPTPAQAGASTAARLTRAALWAILGVVLLADALDLVDSTVTTIAAPTIATDLGGGASFVSWLGASYALAMGTLLVLGGRLGDKYGQRRLFLIGMAGFTLASAACGFALDPAMLLVSRAVQGAFGALLLPQGMAIIARTFPRDMMKKAFNLFGPLLGIAAVGGPVLAGFIISADLWDLSWRPVFLINLVLGTVGIVLAARLLPKDSGDRSIVIDGVGSGLLGLAMFGILFGLVEGADAGWSVLAVVAIVVGLVALGLFARRQATVANPLLRPSLFRNKGFVAGILTGLAFFAVTSGLTFVISLFLQQGLGLAPRATALAILPLTLGIMVAAGAGMGLGDRLGRNLVLIGVALTFVGAAWMFLLVRADGVDLTVWQLVPAVFVVGLGMGAGYGTIFDFALGDLSPEEAGSASGTMTAIQQIATGIGSAIVTTVFFQAVDGGFAHAMTLTLGVVMAIVAACVPVVFLLPKVAHADDHGMPAE